MPCYLFTFHAYGSWLPDRPQGYMRRGQGIQQRDPQMAARYAANLKESEARFDTAIQRLLIDALVEACVRQECQCQSIATEITHFHVLVSWSSDRDWTDVRRQLGTKASRTLNEAVERRTWFAKSPSRKRVRDRKHFDYLVKTYLPRHQGLKWSPDRGVFE